MVFRNASVRTVFFIRFDFCGYGTPIFCSSELTNNFLTFRRHFLDCRAFAEMPTHVKEIGFRRIRSIILPSVVVAWDELRKGRVLLKQTLYKLLLLDLKLSSKLSFPNSLHI